MSSPPFSLMEDVITAESFSNSGAHIPYRNSKLTHLLENAISGNANIAVICTLSLEDRHASETLETLKFANRCAQVETRAVKGVVSGEGGKQRGKKGRAMQTLCSHNHVSSDSVVGESIVTGQGRGNPGIEVTTRCPQQSAKTGKHLTQSPAEARGE